jgi:hypothetical protein
MARQPGPDPPGEGHPADPITPRAQTAQAAKLHAGNGYDYVYLRQWLRRRGNTHRIARKGIESSHRLGRHRWIIERTMAWLAGAAVSTAATRARRTIS